MSKEIPVTEARAQFSDLINRVGFGKEHIVLTRHGKPLVALVPAETLDQENSGSIVGDSTMLDLSSRPSSQRQDYTIAAQHHSTPPDSTSG